MKNRSFYTFLLGMFSVLFISACDSQPQQPQGEEQGEEQQAQAEYPQQAPLVTVATPMQAKIQEFDTYSGRFEAVDRVDLRARVDGYLDAIHFKDGSIVEKGQLLFTIDQRPFQAALKEAQARLKAAKTGLSLAQVEFGRARKLLDEGFGSKQIYDQRREQRNSSQASVEALEAEVERVKLNLEFTEIRAPIKGRIGRHLIDVGNLISGGAAGQVDSTLTTITALDPIHFYFDVDEQAYLNYVQLNKTGERPGSRNTANPVEISLVDKSFGVFDGRMDFVDNEIDSATGTIRARAIIDNPELILAPGMFGQVRVVGSGVFDAVLVPDTALQTDQSRKFVYVVKDGFVRSQTVELGPVIQGLRVIKSGLDVNAEIIVNGAQRVREGVPVQTEKTEITTNEDMSLSAGKIIK